MSPEPIRLLPRLATFTALALAAACGGTPHPKDLEVTSHAPTTSVETAESIEIQFDKPVVDDAKVGTAVDPAAVTLTPTVAWVGHWRDRQTLVVDPTAALKPGTRYKVALAGELGRRTGGFAFDFVHQPLEVDGLWGVDVNQLAPDGELPIGFNQPVRAKDAAARCVLLDAKGKATALVARTPERVDVTVPVAPKTALEPGAAYTLRCADLVPANGNAPLAAPYTLEVHARPHLDVIGVAPAGDDVPADEVAIEIELSTQVALETIRKAITSTPAIPGLDQGWLDGSGTHYRVTVDLDTQQRYAIKIADLVDIHGQKQLAAYEATFKTGDARPRISMQTGIYAVEASARGYPVWSRNLSRYRMECAAIPRGKLVQLLTTEMNYDPWGGNDDGPIDWKRLGVSTKQHAVAVADAKNKWHLDDVDLGKTCGAGAGARGVYLADISSDEVKPDKDRPWLTPSRRRVLANVTDLGVLIKVGPASGIVWVTSLASADPVAGARVTVYTPAGKPVMTGSTDREGLLKIPGSVIAKAQPAADDAAAAGEGGEEEMEDWDSYRSQRLIAVVEKGADLAVVDGNWANGIQIWNFGVTEERRGGTVQVRGFIQSDRGLYRPGETVHFKGIVREIAQNLPPRVPRDRKVAIEVSDSRGQSVHTGNATLSKFGGFFFDLPLSAEASLGDYHVKATVGTQTFRERFSVEEFRPAAFELDVKAAGAPRPGARLSFAATARYLFGAPVANAEVEWNLRRRPHPVRFAGFDEYSFTEAEGMWWAYDHEVDEYGAFVADGTATTDASGNASIAARDADLPAGGGPQDYIVSINVTDDSDQTIGKSMVVTAHQQDLYLGVHAQEYVQAAGMPFAVNVVALAPDGKRVASPAKLSFIRDEHRCTWHEVGHRSYSRCDRTQAIALERTIQIPATGTATERIYPKDPGQYLVRVETTDARGTKIVTAEPIWVIGKGEAFWSGDESARMTLIASRPSYRPGDTARLVAQANLDRPTALVTIERDGVIEAYTRRLGSASEGIELPIKDAWAPNVFAGVTLVRGRRGPGDVNRPQMKMGVVELKVTTQHKALDVAIELDRAEVRPGEPVTGKVRVTAGGAPVKAELSLSVADEGVLQLIAYQTPNPLATFYASYGLGVDSGTNWNRLARLASPDAGDPDEGGDFGSGNKGRIRSKFVSSAFWQPALVTDARGEAAFAFTAPDNLTAFRVMAVAADAGDRFGASDKRLTINKTLMARPALPRFFASGDTTAIGVVIHNQTDKPGRASVTATATGVSLDKGAATVDVPARGVAKATFTATVPEAEVAKLGFAVAMNGDRDAVEVSVPVIRPRLRETRTVAKGKLEAGGKAVIDLAVSPAALRGESELIVTIDRSGLGDIEPSLRYLVEYPYGCLEQTMSKFIPLAKAKDLAGSLGIASLDATKTDAFLRAGVAKVVRHQQGDGNFSLWPQSDTYPHLTVLAVWGLGEAEKGGVAVPKDAMARGLDALRAWAAASTIKPDSDGATLAMAAYLLARHGVADAAVIGKLYEQRAGLPRWGQAFLLRAMVAARSDRAQIAELKQTLVKSLVVKGDALVATDDAFDRRRYMSSTTRNTAMVLAALIEVAPGDPAIAKLAAGLDSVRRPDGRWDSTQDNLWALVALADYARTVGTGDSTVAVTAGGGSLGKPRVRGAGVAVQRLPLSAVSGDKLELAATGVAHYTVRVTEAKRDDGAARAKGFTVNRVYLDDAGQPLKAIKAGDLVTVKVTVTAANDLPWIALVDPLPAGFEVVNPKLAASADTSRGGPAAAGSDPDAWSPVSWVHQELRDDHVAWFADAMPAGTYTLSYKVRAATAGTFTAMPTRIEAMYEPDAMGRTASAKVVVQP